MLNINTIEGFLILISAQAISDDQDGLRNVKFGVTKE